MNINKKNALSLLDESFYYSYFQIGESTINVAYLNLIQKYI